MMEFLNLLPDLSNQRRLQTFLSSESSRRSPLPDSFKCSISNYPSKLAEAGFVRTHSAHYDEVECRFCGVKYRGWSGESPLAVHRTLNPKCIFLNTPPCSTRCSETAANGIEKSTNELAALRKQLFQGLNISPLSMYNCIDVEHPFLPKQGGYLMLFESHRLLTFIYKDLISSHAEVFAQAGFVYDIQSKSVFCVFCNLKLDFQATSKYILENIHKEKSPVCPFANLYDVGNISLEEEKTIRDKASLQLLNKAQNYNKMKYVIKYPEYEDESSRVGTFSTWPKWLSKAVSSRVMAKCGFYYTGFSDKVACFACGVGLSDWSPEAEPAVQHARASPHCVFLQQFKGRKFIESAQTEQLIVEKDQETTISQTPESDASTSTTVSSSSTSSLRSKGLSAVSASTSALGSPVLDLEAIRAALACQYTLEQITRAIKTFFTISFRYPNATLLLGTLMAGDEQHQRLCEKSQEVIEKEALYQKKEAHFLAKEAQLTAEKAAYQQQLIARDRELRRTTFELGLRDVVRTELEHKLTDQIQQQKEMLQQVREQVEQRDHIIEYKEIQIHDQEKHILSLRAELTRRTGTSSDDEESTSSDLEQSSSDSSTCSDEIPLANCKICLVKPSQIMFIPCKHICCCDSCASRLRGKNCPICREHTFGMEKVYLI